MEWVTGTTMEWGVEQPKAGETVQLATFLRTKEVTKGITAAIARRTGEAADGASLWSSRTVKRMIKAGIVQVDGTVCTVVGQTLVHGETVSVDAARLFEIHIEHARKAALAAVTKVLHIDDDVMVLDVEAGVSKLQLETSILPFLANAAGGVGWERPAHPAVCVSRKYRAASGLVVAASENAQWHNAQCAMHNARLNRILLGPHCSARICSGARIRCYARTCRCPRRRPLAPGGGQ